MHSVSKKHPRHCQIYNLKKDYQIPSVLFFQGSAEADVGWGGNMNGPLTASCVGNIRTKIYQSLIISVQVIIDENVGDLFWHTPYNQIRSTMNYASSMATSGSSVPPLSPFDAWNEKVRLIIAATTQPTTVSTTIYSNASPTYDQVLCICQYRRPIILWRIILFKRPIILFRWMPTTNVQPLMLFTLRQSGKFRRQRAIRILCIHFTTTRS